MSNTESLIHIVWVIPISVLIAIFINYAADVLPITRSLLTKPICPQCKQTFDFVNYITFRNCFNCNMKRALRYLFVLLIIPVFFLWLYFFLNKPTQWLLAVIILTYLTIIFLIDLEHRLILHPTSIIGAFLFFGIGLLRNGFVKTLLGGVAGFLIMFILYVFGILFNRWMSKRRGETIEEAALGYGDVNLSGVLGLLLGWPGIGICLFFAIIGGGVFSGIWLLIMLIRRKYEAFTPIPYAPFLILASIFILYLSITN